MAETAIAVCRRFSDLPFGQIHYREAGIPGGRPLVLLHGSPGSAAQLVPLIATLAEHRHVIAPDTPGFGDSAPHPLNAPSIADFADTLVQWLDEMGLADVDLYGFHTGACIAAETAIARPDLVHRIVLDGVGLYANGERDRLLAHYAHPFESDQHGAYLIRAFHFLRDQSLFWPWFDRTRSARRDGGLMPADRLHGWLIELLKAAGTYHLGYRAAFRWDAMARLPLLRHAMMIVAAADDPLADDSMTIGDRLAVAAWLRLPRSDDPAYQNDRAEHILKFLNISASGYKNL
ncbi:hypothetical protein ASE85_08340 [Sphingobium sp. Leaf26]|uniref:alpha/beta fold hydrolase n=1 Tax=Sphingobium sp. Leaf26 TaxID=1735693 RepID=UPI0007013C64|nr:alpha/beta fold hydrolase [Sphingobium sp. Leaf26]KQN00651.1 hypothetical protein ASE85_08340 [Sphingobium sp. Leaf26]